MSHAKQILPAIKEHGGAFKALAKATGLTPDQVKWGVKFLVDKGLVRRIRPGLVRLTSAGRRTLEGEAGLWSSGPKAPHPLGGDTLRARLWRALFNRKKAYLGDLLTLALRDENPRLARQDACAYLRALERAGIVVRHGESPSSLDIQWFLARDTGFRPPQYNKRAKRVYDPNTGEVFDVA